MSAPHISNFPTMSQFLWPSWCRASDETIHTGKPPVYVEIAMASYRLVLATHFSPLVGCILRGVAEMLGVSLLSMCRLFVLCMAVLQGAF